MQKQPEPTPNPCLEHPGQNPHQGTNPHREKQSLHQRENVRGGYTRLAMGGKSSTVTVGWRTEVLLKGPSHPQPLFSILLNLGWEQSPWSLGNESLHYPS